MGHHFESYCFNPEDIENYENAKKDNFIGWDCHHRLETHTSDGERRIVNITQKELIALGMYYNRPASELIFITKSEHNKFQEGWHHTEEVKEKIGKASKGRRHTKEAKKKMSKASKGKQKTKEHRKNIAEAARINSTGRHWYHNDKYNFFCYECPPGCEPGMLKK